MLTIYLSIIETAFPLPFFSRQILFDLNFCLVIVQNKQKIVLHADTGVYILAISPPPAVRGELGTLWSLGKKIGPSREKILRTEKVQKFIKKTFS